ncbi:MAG: hypothetical protein JXO72_15760 [Vicinamibacteria bacterium]|nr:hypothetical protein [Vicinamibacteria bacterium]
MNRVATVLTVAFLGLLPRFSIADGLEVRAGAFFPRADSGAREEWLYDLFQDHSDLYTVGRSDWVGGVFGIEFTRRLAPHLELGLHVDGYSRTNDTSYRDDRAVLQTLRLSMVPLGISLKLLASDRRASIQPYIAVGGDLVIWKYEAWGEFYLDADSYDFDWGEFESTGVAPGLHVAAGVRVPISYDFSLTAEGRYQWAESDMGDDFLYNRIDLSGASATVGFHMRF